MKLKKNYQLKINVPDTVNIEKKKEILFISGPLGFTELNLKKLDSSGVGAIKLREVLPLSTALNLQKNNRWSVNEKNEVSALLTEETINENKNFIVAATKVPLVPKPNENYLKSPKKLIFFSTNSKSFFGCVSSIIQNKIYGVTRGFLIYIRVIGVGYRAQLQGIENQMLYLKVGFSHDIKFEVPKAVRAFLLEPTLICLYGIDKNQLTQIASKIKKIKIPSVYKGKGIRLVNEKIILKTGKKR